MCQILALTSNSPTDISFSFEGFINRAGITDTNVDGTGIAFFEEGQSVRILKDERRGVDSYVRNLVRLYQIKSKNIIAHIRRASQGVPTLANCHPFVREIWGESWVFAHNGHLESFPGVTEEAKKFLVGDTDSELFFSILALHLGKKFPQRPGCEELFHEVCKFTDTYSQAGILNFVLSNGNCMIAHCSTNLYWITRTAKCDSLTRRIDDGGVINLSCYAKEDDKVSIICTMPITYEKWQKMENGQMNLFINGERKLTYYGTPNYIDKKYEALTGLSSTIKEKVEAEQKHFARQELEEPSEEKGTSNPPSITSCGCV